MKCWTKGYFYPYSNTITNTMFVRSPVTDKTSNKDNSAVQKQLQFCKVFKPPSFYFSTLFFVYPYWSFGYIKFLKIRLQCFYLAPTLFIVYKKIATTWESLFWRRSSSYILYWRNTCPRRCGFHYESHCTVSTLVCRSVLFFDMYHILLPTTVQGAYSLTIGNCLVLPW